MMNFDTNVVLWIAPSFRDEVTEEAKNGFYGNLAEMIDQISHPFRDFNAKYQQPLFQLDLASQRAREPILNEMKAIFARNPQLATVDDRLRFFDIEKVSAEDRQRLAQQRAIIRSFDNLFIGWTRKVLEWPTIASTLLVTLATGWLGGLVNFMGAAISAQLQRDQVQTAMPDFFSLFRRSFLGITAALGIFLAAGSGLLILTAQSNSAPAAAGAIELSPYFVAFLAFISGFLADDAFARLASAGRKLFEVKAAVQPAQQQKNGGMMLIPTLAPASRCRMRIVRTEPAAKLAFRPGSEASSNPTSQRRINRKHRVDGRRNSMRFSSHFQFALRLLLVLATGVYTVLAQTQAPPPMRVPDDTIEVIPFYQGEFDRADFNLLGQRLPCGINLDERALTSLQQATLDL